MSKVSIQGDASGTGTLTIAAPNTNSNYTLTLPTNTGTVMTSASDTFAGGLTLGGDLTLDSNGIYLGGTGAANYLDDYETGDWTPGLSGTTVSGGTITGSYIKVGSLVTAIFAFDNITLASSSGIAQVTNLPFTVGNSGKYRGSFVLGVSGGVTASASHGGIGYPNGTNAYFFNSNSASTATFVNGSGKYIFGTINYYAA